MTETLTKIMNIMNEIEYGFLDQDNQNLAHSKNWDEKFPKIYYLLSPEELLKTKVGTCFDQVELERKLFNDYNILVKTYFIYSYISKDNIPSHTFLTFEYQNKIYWFEHSWYQYKGIHEYLNLNNLLHDIKNKFLKSHNLTKNENTSIYEYKLPPYHLTCDEFYEYCQNSKLIEIK